MIQLHNANGEFRLTPAKAFSFASRHAVQATLMLRYAIRNRIRRRSLIESTTDAIVSLTTHGKRIRTVYLAIESIGGDSTRPRGIVLWVDAASLAEALRIPALGRLQRRGLEIRSADETLGSHKKYFPFVNDPALSRSPLVTADDDLFYPRDWFASLWHAFEAEGRTAIVSSWVKRVGLTAGGLAAYSTWKSINDISPCVGRYLMSGSGTIFPPEFAAVLASAGERFRECTPRADDIWLNEQALANGFRVRQSTRIPLALRAVPGTQASKLSHENVVEMLNDRQLAATYSPSDLATLLALPCASADPSA